MVFVVSSSISELFDSTDLAALLNCKVWLLCIERKKKSFSHCVYEHSISFHCGSFAYLNQKKRKNLWWLIPNERYDGILSLHFFNCENFVKRNKECLIEFEWVFVWRDCNELASPTYGCIIMRIYLHSFFLLFSSRFVENSFQVLIFVCVCVYDRTPMCIEEETTTLQNEN